MNNLGGYIQMRFPGGHAVGDEWETRCPRCDNSKHRFFINRIDGRYQCKHCSFAGHNFLSLISKVEKLYGRALQQWITQNKTELETPLLNKRLRIPMDVSLPDYCGHIRIGDEFSKYLSSRGLPFSHIKKYNVLCCREGKYKDRLVVPVYEDGKLVYFFDRSIKDNTIKTLGVGSQGQYWPIKKSSVVYNLNLVRPSDHVMIAEGVFDALALEVPFLAVPVALLGKSCSEIQLAKLVGCKAESYCVCLDADALYEAVSLAYRLAEYVGAPNVYIRRFIEGDPNGYLLKQLPWPKEECWYDVASRYKTEAGFVAKSAHRHGRRM